MNLSDIPDYMQPSIVRYVERGIPPGDFLRRVLCNDLVGSCGHADINNLACIAEYARILMMEVPSGCWGSDEIVDSWIQQGGQKGA